MPSESTEILSNLREIAQNAKRSPNALIRAHGSLLMSNILFCINYEIQCDFFRFYQSLEHSRNVAERIKEYEKEMGDE